MQTAIQSLAFLTCTVFAGAAIYINLVEHPARMSCGTRIAATVWVPSYGRATMELRASWETGHAIRFVLQLGALSLLVISVLYEIRTDAS